MRKHRGGGAEQDIWTPIEQGAPADLLGTWRGTATQTIPADPEKGLNKNSSMNLSITMTVSSSQISMTETVNVKQYLLDLAGGSEAGAQLLWAFMKSADTGAEGVSYADASMTITYRYTESLGGAVKVDGNKSSADVYINQSKNKLKIVTDSYEDSGSLQIILQKT